MNALDMTEHRSYVWGFSFHGTAVDTDRQRGHSEEGEERERERDG